MRFSLILLCFFTSITICLEDGISHFTVAIALYCPYKKTWWYHAELIEDEYDDGRYPKGPKENTVTGQLQFFTLEADFEEKDGKEEAEIEVRHTCTKDGSVKTFAKRDEILFWTGRYENEYSFKALHFGKDPHA